MQNSYDEPQEKSSKRPSLIVIFGALLLLGIASIFILEPNGLLSTRQDANANAAQETMRLINSVQSTYINGFGKGQYGTAEELFKEDFIDSVTASALGVPVGTKSVSGQEVYRTNEPKSGYTFK